MSNTKRKCDDRSILLTESWDNQHAIIEAGDFAAKAGFNKTEQALISTAVSELATNILRYAGRGELHLRTVHEKSRTGIEVVAVDRGPGIENIEQAMTDNYTTTKGSLGLGLPSVRRIMDDFLIESSPKDGTRVVARKWRAHGKN